MDFGRDNTEQWIEEKLLILMCSPFKYHSLMAPMLGGGELEYIRLYLGVMPLRNAQNKHAIGLIEQNLIVSCGEPLTIYELRGLLRCCNFKEVHQFSKRYDYLDHSGLTFEDKHDLCHRMRIYKHKTRDLYKEQNDIHMNYIIMAVRHQLDAEKS
jgi:hypothetical protein